MVLTLIVVRLTQLYFIDCLRIDQTEYDLGGKRTIAVDVACFTTPNTKKIIMK